MRITYFSIAVAAALLAGTIRVPAQQTLAAAARSDAKAYPAARLSLVQSARDLTKTPVLDRDGKRLGNIRDFVLDLNSGRVWCAFVGPANLYGAPDYFVAIPAASFLSADAEGAVVDLKDTNLIGAPRFVATRWEPDALSAYMHRTFEAFHEKMPADANPQLARASSFYGMKVNNPGGANIGQLDDFALDLPRGRLLFAALSFYGSQKNEHAIPTAVLALAPNSRSFVLATDNAQTSLLVHPNDYLWTAMTDPAFVAASYRAFGRQLAFDYAPAFDAATATTLLRTEPPVMVPADNSLANKSSSDSDSNITRSILTALMGADFDSDASLQNLKISTTNGKVTLSGKVAGDAEKNRLGSIAERIAGAGNVVNDLTVQ